MSKWEKVKLSDAFELRMGKTPSRNNLSYWNDGSNKWISIADIGLAEKYIYSTKETISDLAIKESGIKKVPKNTVIMSFKLSLGKTCIASEDMYTNEAIMAFINKGKYEIDEHYLYYLFKGKDWTAGTNKAVMGVTLNKATLSNVTIPVPSLEVQKKIAKNLDTVFELLALRKKQLEELDGLIKSVFYDMFGDPVTNDKGWEKNQVKAFAEVKIGPFGSLLHAEDYISGGYPIINPSHIINDKIVPDHNLTINDDKYKELHKYSLMKDDVVVARRGEIGRCAVVEDEGLFCGTGSFFIRVFKDYSPIVLQYIISSQSIRSLLEHHSVGVTMKNLNSGTIGNLEVPMIPVEYQNKFVEIKNQIEKQKVLVKQSIDETQTLFDTLMGQYFD